MLPDNMFLNLIDMVLQQKIAMMDDLDGSAAEALKLLLETAPTSMTKGLENRNDKWTKHSFLQRKELYTKKYGLMMRNSEKLS